MSDDEMPTTRIDLDGTERVDIELPLALLDLAPELIPEIDRCFYRCAISKTENDQAIPEDTMILHCSTAAVGYLCEEFTIQGDVANETGYLEMGESLLMLADDVAAQMMAQILDTDIENIQVDRLSSDEQ